MKSFRPTSPLVLPLVSVFAILLLFLHLQNAVAQDCQPGEITHVIQRGENLFRISLNYGVPLSEVAARNNISDPTLIFADDVLCIPASAALNGNEAPDAHQMSQISDGGDPKNNWCYEGGPWGDGRCNDPDPYVQAYNWMQGWIAARCDDGIFPQGNPPSVCAPGAPPPPPPSGTQITASCQWNSITFTMDATVTWSDLPAGETITATLTTSGGSDSRVSNVASGTINLNVFAFTPVPGTVLVTTTSGFSQTTSC